MIGNFLPTFAHEFVSREKNVGFLEVEKRSMSVLASSSELNRLLRQKMDDDKNK